MLYFCHMKNVFWLLIAIGSTFLVSEYIFVPAKLYYEFLWLDIPMHILGGFLIGSLSIALLKVQKKKHLISLRHVIAYVLCIAIIWEVSESYKGVVDYGTVWGWLDTLKDLVNGVIGAVLAYKICQK